MKFNTYLTVLRIGFYFSISIISSVQASTAQEQIIEDMLHDLAGINKVPAHSVAIAMHGNLVAQVTIGEKDTRNKIPATTETTFRLASVSKVVAATMLANLVQQGLLDPDRPVGDYLPDLAGVYQDLTARQLLAHISGMPHYQARDAQIDDRHYDSATEALGSLGERELLAEPGEIYQYSSLAYTILGALFEAITQQSLQSSVTEFMEEMTGRKTPVLEDVTKRNPQRSNVFEVEQYGVTTLKQKDQSYSPFATGFIASASDLAMFGDAVLHNKSISMATRELMFSPIYLNDGSKTGNYRYEVAFGWRVGTDNAGRRVYHHAGVTQGARSVLIIYPDFGLSIALLSNARWTASIERTGFSLADIFLDQQSMFQLSGRYEFSGNFRDEAIEGYLQCEDEPNGCLFVDKGGPLSQWLKTYNHIEASRESWPVMVVQSSSGVVLKLVTSVGFVDLQSSVTTCPELCVEADLGNNRLLSIRFLRRLQ